MVDLGLASHAQIPFTAVRLKRELSTMNPSLIIVKLWSSLLACSLIDRDLPQHRFNYCEDLDPKTHAKFIRFGRLKQFLIGRIFRSREILTANTSTVAQSMMQVYGLEKLPLIIPSTIDAKLVRKQLQPVQMGTAAIPRIVSVGSLRERKGLVESFEVLSQLKIPLEWHLVGEGPLRGYFEDLATRPSNVKIVIHGGRPDPYSVVKQCDLLLHNSPSEAFGIVLLESLAVGTPVVAASAIGPAEMTSKLGVDPRFIKLFPWGNEELMKEAVLNRLSEERCVLEDAVAYIEPYSLHGAVDSWLEHAKEVFQ